MTKRLERRAGLAAPANSRMLKVPAEQLPFADGSFGTVVATPVFCTVVDPPAALLEARRVLRDGGQADEHLDCRQIVCNAGAGGVGERIGRSRRVAADRLSGEDRRADKPCPCGAGQGRCCPAGRRITGARQACVVPGCWPGSQAKRSGPGTAPLAGCSPSHLSLSGAWMLSTAVWTGRSLRRCQSADPGYRQAARRLPAGTTGPRHRAPGG
jgi:SAM-dependent methyltransferase